MTGQAPHHHRHPTTTPPASPGLTPPAQADSQQARLNLPAVITAPRDARHFTTEKMTAWQLPPDAILHAKTVVTELITNSYQATRASPAACISLTLRRLPGEIIIEVSDNGPGLPAVPDAADDAENGRGLLMVEAMSKEWGYRPQPDGGKVTYAIVAVPP